MRIWIRFVLYLVVFIGYSSSIAGSYDDFFAAIQANKPDVVQALLKRGFDPNTLNPRGEHGLVVAVNERAFKVIDVLLGDANTQPEVRTTRDESALMLASLKGYLDVCKKLIARDADVNKPGWTPLHYAATSGHLDVIRLLVEHHAYVDASSPNGSTPLMMAAMYGTIEAVKLLLAEGADPQIKNALGLTAIDFAAKIQKDDVVAYIASVIRARHSTGTW
jgi:ankyrin repeat protein